CSFTRRPATSPLFPYTTLFRSMAVMDSDGLTPGFAGMAVPSVMCRVGWPHTRLYGSTTPRSGGSEMGAPPMKWAVSGMLKISPRSEEHTSELQSRFDLVCRLLL